MKSPQNPDKNSHKSSLKNNIMKKAIQISTILLATLFYGQSVSNFKYILIPQKFKNEKANKYDLNTLLASKLKAKKFVVITENSIDQPAEVRNPCEMLKAEVTDASNMFTNKVRIDFKDCNEKTVASLEGKSNIKEFEEGMRAALVASLNNLSPSNPSDQILISKQESVALNTQQKDIKKESNNSITAETINVSGENTSSNQTAGKVVQSENSSGTKAEVYSNGSLALNKIILGNGEFILVNPNNSIPYATFKPSKKKDVFRVQLQDGTTTLGFLEAGKILIEIPNSDGSFRNEEFLKK